MAAVIDVRNGRLDVKEEFRDRIQKADTHAVWGVVLYFSSKQAAENAISVMSGVGYYYALFHCAFSMTCLDFDIKDKDLQRVSHKQLTNFLKKEVKLGIATEELLKLFNDARYVREFVNYLGGETGHDKFMNLRHPISFITESFGKISFLNFLDILEKECKKVLDELMFAFKNIEKINKRSIFPCVHRTYDFDYYGEDFLENFFTPTCTVINEVENYLKLIEG